MDTIELCKNMMIYCVYSDNTRNMNPSELIDNLKIFFTQETIDSARNTMLSGAFSETKTRSE